jgi:hypothetical protein
MRSKIGRGSGVYPESQGVSEADGGGKLTHLPLGSLLKMSLELKLQPLVVIVDGDIFVSVDSRLFLAKGPL